MSVQMLSIVGRSREKSNFFDFWDFFHNLCALSFSGLLMQTLKILLYFMNFTSNLTYLFLQPTTLLIPAILML